MREVTGKSSCPPDKVVGRVKKTDPDLVEACSNESTMEWEVMPARIVKIR